MKILGIDIGFGDTKVIMSNDNGQFTKKFKFSSIIGITKSNEYIKDLRIYNFKGNSYYVGSDAMSLPSKSLIDIIEYKNLEYYAPLLLAHAIKLCGETPDVIVTGLSKAQILNSGNFRDSLMNFEVNGINYKFKNVFVIPQGAGSKLCIDKYGYDFPNLKTEFTASSNYIGVDIGFNTLDMFKVSDGKTSPDVFQGVEHEGIMKVASKIAKLIKEKHDRDINLHEAKEIINTNSYKLRGQIFNYSSEIVEIKKQYIKELLELIERSYGDILDKCDFIFLSGGGSAIFTSGNYLGNTVYVPKSNYEFYNAVGQAMSGQELVKKNKIEAQG